jgi:hypothetical protein
VRQVLLRLSGFAIFPLLSLVTPLLLLPIVSSVVGGSGISSVVSGQAIGGFAATVLIWGWNIEGPVSAARAESDDARAILYARSVRTRLLLLVVVLPAAIVVSVVVALPGFAVDASCMAVANVIVGLSPAWFCIGVGKPRLLALYDTLPRVIATVIASPVVLATDSLLPYAGIMVVASAVSLAVFHRRHSPRQPWFPLHLRETFRDLGKQAKTAGISLVGNAYAATPAPIATVTSSAVASGRLSSADTLYRFGLFSVIALGNAFQGWTLEPGLSTRHRRHVVAIVAHVILGLAGLVIITTLGPLVSSLLFAGRAQATTELCFYYGVAFLFLSASTPFIRNLLIPAARQQTVLVWSLISAVFGIVAMLFAGITGHPTLIPLGMAGSEALIALGLLLPGLRVLVSERTAEA